MYHLNALQILQDLINTILFKIYRYIMCFDGVRGWCRGQAQSKQKSKMVCLTMTNEAWMRVWKAKQWRVLFSEEKEVVVSYEIVH